MSPRNSKHLAFYIRQSRSKGEGDKSGSVAAQKAALRKWAEYEGVPLPASDDDWFIDVDKSGGAKNRPQLDRAVEAILDGELGGLVCIRVDRFHRNTLHGLQGLQQMKACDARLVFTDEKIDTATPMGTFVYTLMLAMGQLFLDNMTEHWQTKKTAATQDGRKVGTTPFGYRRAGVSRAGLPNGLLVIEPREAAIMRRTYELAADGLAAAAEYFSAATERYNAPSEIARRLAQRCYLGEHAWDGVDFKDSQLAIVSTLQWERANATAEREAAGGRPKRRAKQDYVLSGIAECSKCHRPMIGAMSDGVRKYRCSGYANRRRLCDQASTIREDVLLPYVLHVIEETYTLGEPVELAGDSDAGALAALEAAVQQARDDHRVALKRSVRLDDADAEEFLEPFEETLQEAQRALLTAERRVVVMPTRAELEAMTPAGLHAQLRGMFRAIEVGPGRRGGVQDVRERVVIRDHVQHVPHDPAAVREEDVQG